jgi:hypothetical protein
MSGLNGLQEVISRHFAPRARVLQARTALAGLRAIVRAVKPLNPALASDVERRVEEIEATTVQFAQVRAAHLVSSGAVTFAAEEMSELDRILNSSDPTHTLGLAPDTPTSEVLAATLAGISRWRTLAGDPLADPRFIEVCEVAARTLEQIYSDRSDASE